MKIQNGDGLSIEYNKEELLRKFPHLISELSNKGNLITSKSIMNKIEELQENPSLKKDARAPNELTNPGAVDFIRRCRTNEEALEIIDFLLGRKELTREEYDELHDKIIQEGGLKKLIEESGGFKKIGYYERKYYKKQN